MQQSNVLSPGYGWMSNLPCSIEHIYIRSMSEGIQVEIGLVKDTSSFDSLKKTQLGPSHALAVIYNHLLKSLQS